MLSKDNEQAILITQARKNILTNFCYKGLGYMEWYCNLTTDTCNSFNTYTFLMKPFCNSEFS